jgi:hypothetical protein
MEPGLISIRIHDGEELVPGVVDEPRLASISINDHHSARTAVGVDFRSSGPSLQHCSSLAVFAISM